MGGFGAHVLFEGECDSQVAMRVDQAAHQAASPGIDITLHLVGREACLRRIDRALNHIAQSAALN